MHGLKILAMPSLSVAEVVMEHHVTVSHAKLPDVNILLHFVARIVPELHRRRYPSGIPGTPIPSPLSSASSLEPPPPPPIASASPINYSASAMPTTSSSYASPAQTAYRSSQQDSKR